MADSPSQPSRALSAHVEGLRAALEALPTDPESGASLRRIARSLRTAADAAGASELADAARRLREADDERLEVAALAALRTAEEFAEQEAPDALEILIVEDNRTVATALRAYLEGPGHAVSHAATAKEAERLLADRPIDVVLLDLILPDRDGRDLLVQMREQAATADVPVLVLSAKEGAVAKAECLAVGAAEFLEKPVKPKELRAAVARHARPRSSRTVRGGPSRGVPSRADLVESYEPLRCSGQDRGMAAVALLAVDDLDRLVERMGDEAADGLLGAMIAPLTKGLDEDALVGRWARGQLVMLLPGADASVAKRHLKDAMARLAASGIMDDLPREGSEVSFSAGVAVAEPGQELRDVVSEAEAALLRARAAGRGVLVRPDEAERTSASPGEPADEEEPADGPRRVLLVEDDRVTATLIHHRLEREGFEVVAFDNGDDAHAWTADESFDLAILDVKVPGMDGFELLERLRAVPRLESVPVVMLTGLGGEADVVRGLTLGANDYMLKPFSPAELLARVRRLVFADATAASGSGGPQGAPAGVGAH